MWGCYDGKGSFYNMHYEQMGYGQINRCGFLMHENVITNLIDMYAKCWSSKIVRVFL